MVAALLKPLTYAGSALSNEDMQMEFLRGQGVHDNPVPTPVSVERIGTFPAYVRTQPGAGKVFVMSAFPTGINPDAVRETLRQLFDPTKPADTFEVMDANGIVKTCIAVPQGIYYQVGGFWNIPLWAPDPTLISKELLTHSVANLTGSAQVFSPAVVNDGDVASIPSLVEFEPQVINTAWAGWAKMFELTYAWRSEFPATGAGSGTWLLEVTDGGWNTAVIVDVSAITDTCTTTISASQVMSRGTPFLITIGATAGWDSKGLLLADPDTGSEEQFEYEVIDGTTLGLTAKALGGTSPIIHTASFTVHQSRMMVDGRDIAVFINNIKVPDKKVNINGMNTSSTKIWVEYSEAPAKKGIIQDVGDGTDSETDFVLEEVDHGFLVGDYLVRDSGGADETVRVSTIDGRNITVVRAVRNSSSSAVAVGDIFYRVGTHFQVAYYWSLAPSRPTNPDPPLLDQLTSTNLQWEWTTAPIWADANRRAAAWSRGLYTGRAVIASRLSAKIGLDVTGALIRFADVLPTALKPNFDMVEFKSACGIDSSAGAIEYDASIPWNLALEVIGRDLLGFDTLIQRRHGHESGSFHGVPHVYTNRKETPESILSSILFRVHNLVVTGILTTDDVDESLGGPDEDSTGVDWQIFTLDEATPLFDLVVRTRRVGSSDKTVQVLIRELNSDGAPDPADTERLIDPTGWFVAAAGLGTSYGELCFFLEPTNIILSAGSYGIQYYFNAGSTGDIEWSQENVPIYTRGIEYEMGPVFTIGKKPGKNLWCAILSADVDNQPEAPDETGEVLTMSDILVKFDLTRTPLVLKQADEDAYYLDTKVTRSGSTDEIRIRFLDRWADLDGFVIAINIQDRTVVGSRYSDDLRPTASFGNDDWLLIPAGESVIIADSVHGQSEGEDLSLQFRDTWQS